MEPSEKAQQRRPRREAVNPEKPGARPPSAGAAGSAARHKASSRSRTGRGVFQVIQVDPHDLPADVRREQPEAIEARTLGLDALLQGECYGFLVQGYGNGAVAALGGWVVDQGPVVDLPWREDRPGSSLGSGSLGGRKRGVEVVADARRPADVGAEKMPRLHRWLLLVGAVKPT